MEVNRIVECNALIRFASESFDSSKQIFVLQFTRTNKQNKKAEISPRMRRWSCCELISIFITGAFTCDVRVCVFVLLCRCSFVLFSLCHPEVNWEMSMFTTVVMLATIGCVSSDNQNTHTHTQSHRLCSAVCRCCHSTVVLPFATWQIKWNR